MDAFPAFVPLRGRRVVVLGDGRPADEKAALFAGAPCVVARLPEGPAGLDEATYAGADLVFIASDDAGYAAAAAKAARRAGALLVNVVDKPALCDFYTPAIVDRGQVVAAVGTTGAAPALAGRLRQAIEAAVPEGMRPLAALLTALRPAIRARLADFDARKRFVLALIDGPAGAAAIAGRAKEALTLAEAALAEAS